ncbi:MAG: major capsid protein [Clostridium sp.]|nr:major capsid protein [Clostridium sp.]
MANGPFGTGKIADYTGVINSVPQVKNKVTNLNLFESESLSVSTAIIDVDGYDIGVLGTHSRRSPAKRIKHENAKQLPIIVPHIELEDYVYPEDVEEKRMPGSQEVDKLSRVRAKRLTQMSSDIDLTHEYFRLSAIKGQTKDGNGKVLFDAYTALDKTQTAIEFDMTSASGLRTKLLDIKRAIEDANDTGGMISNIVCLCSPSLFNALISNAEIAEAYGNQVGLPNPMRDDLRANFIFEGIVFIEYNGSVKLENGTTEKMIEDDVAYFFPTGLTGMFKEYYAPKTDMTYVNTDGVAKYASEYSDPEGKWLKLSAETNALMINTRPHLVVKLTNKA